MKKAIIFILAMSCIGANAREWVDIDTTRQVKLDEVVVSAIRAVKDAPIAYSNVNEVQIKSNNAAKNIPFVLQALPSVVVYTEGGTPVGNTSFRIRGTGSNRINVTLNGMPLNNPESQDVYWVNLPDLSNSLQSLQVQRGVGTATNGAASFGASVSMQTIGGQPKAYADLSSAYGQYNTMLLSAAAGTGIMKNGLSLDARYSYTKSDGYVRNGKVDHKNLFATLSHYTDKQMIRLVYINGNQHTGITWIGVEPDTLRKDRRYNSAGKYIDDNGKPRYYDNETDNYYSNIAQLLYTRQLNSQLTLNANISYNNGYGYYENYKMADPMTNYLAMYGLSPQVVNGTTYSETDLIGRELMANDLYFGSMSINYHKDKLTLTGGAMYSFYDGDNYGKLMWVKYNQNIADDYKWYDNNSKKKDMNAFVKGEFRPSENLSLFAEVQDRYIDYRMKGPDDDLFNLNSNNYYNFLNPKAGASFRFNRYNEVYGSFAVSNREPLRTDLKNASKGGGREVKPERLYDYELGYRYSNPLVAFSANLYYMDYKDQLVQTGKVDHVGYKLQENVADSYRAGIELALAYTPTYWLRLDGNLTLSRNKINDYTAYFDLYDNQTDWNLQGEQASEYHKSTDISFSPNTVGSGIITFSPFEGEDFSLSFSNKYVGRMYYDNTSNPNNRLSDYVVTDMIASYTLKTEKSGSFDFQFFINNMLSFKYESNAWVDTVKFQDGSQMVYKGLFPQAGANLMGKVRYRF